MIAGLALLSACDLDLRPRVLFEPGSQPVAEDLQAGSWAIDQPMLQHSQICLEQGQLHCWTLTTDLEVETREAAETRCLRFDEAGTVTMELETLECGLDTAAGEVGDSVPTNGSFQAPVIPPEDVSMRVWPHGMIWGQKAYERMDLEGLPLVESHGMERRFPRGTPPTDHLRLADGELALVAELSDASQQLVNWAPPWELSVEGAQQDGETERYQLDGGAEGGALQLTHRQLEEPIEGGTWSRLPPDEPLDIRLHVDVLYEIAPEDWDSVGPYPPMVVTELEIHDLAGNPVEGLPIQVELRWTGGPTIPITEGWVAHHGLFCSLSGRDRRERMTVVARVGEHPPLRESFWVQLPGTRRMDTGTAQLDAICEDIEVSYSCNRGCGGSTGAAFVFLGLPLLLLRRRTRPEGEDSGPLKR